MNKFLKPGFWILPAIFVLATILLFNITGCRGGSDGGTPILTDSVKPHVISLKDAIELTARFRSSIDTFHKKCPDLKDSLRFGNSEAFNKDCYNLLLAQKDSNGVLAAGIRIYYGLGKEGQAKLILVPYDTSGNDILHHLISLDVKQVPGVSSAHTESLSVGDDAQALEQGQRCPPTCPTGPLNGGGSN